MEFPGLGRNCGVGTCNRLDFLPMKCDACDRVFCKDHFTYNEHSCLEAYRKDNQVPVCPLCNKPIPVGPGQTPDGRVGQHIDTDCQSNPAKEHRGKIFKNRCSLAKCRKKEMVPLSCPSCHLNFCLAHRLEADHDCAGSQPGSRPIPAPVRIPASPRPAASTAGRPAATAGAAAIQRQRQLQGGMTESEAMAMALRLSAADSQPAPTQDAAERERQEYEDRLLAEALAASEREARQQQQGQQQQQRGVRASDNNNSCNVS